MQPTSLGIGRLLTMAFFALSCFGLLLFLWMSFGGAAPLKPQGYRVQLAFPEAATLAEQADVRVSGVPIGKVVALDRTGGRTLATLEIAPRFAPLRRDVRATLRAKTLLGETFVELTPGSATAPGVPENGRIPDGAVRTTTEIDELLATFDAPTRRALRSWVTGWSKAVRGRAQDVQGVVAALEPLGREGDEALARLQHQDRALRSLVRDAGTVFRTIGRRRTATRELVRSSERLFAATATRDDELRSTLRELPAFLRALRPGLTELEAITREADPVVRALEPAARLVRPVLRETVATAPLLGDTLRDLGALGRTGPADLAALQRTLRAAGPLVEALHPVARDLIPVAQYASLYRKELVSSWPAVASATQMTTQRPGEDPQHYFRAVLPITDENFVVHTRRTGTSRTNAYPRPGWLDRLADGLESFDCSHAVNPRTLPGTGAPPPCLLQTPAEFQGQRRSFKRLERAAP